MKNFQSISVILFVFLFYSCSTNPNYKVYKTGDVIDSTVYSEYVVKKEIDRGVGKETELVISKGKLGRGDILTFRGSFKGTPASYSFQCFGTEKDKGDYKFKNGITTHHTRIAATKDYDDVYGSVHYLHKYYIDGELVLIRDEDVAKDIFAPHILNKKMIDYNGKAQ